jgi:nucleotide-binding universal stress UspA family protein
VEVIRAVKTGGHDLVVKTAHGEAKTSPGSFGSTDMHLLRKCPCPVWLAQPRDLQREGKQRRLLAAVNPLPDPDDPANALNLRILELATWLAGEERAKLFVVRAHESIGEAFLADSLGPDEYAGYLEHIQVVRLKSDQEIIGRFENRAEQMEVRYVMGDPGEAIPAVARDEGIDLIIMGTVARTGIPGLLIGRTAENVLQQVSCSVLGLKPEGFVAPF